MAARGGESSVKISRPPIRRLIIISRGVFGLQHHLNKRLKEKPKGAGKCFLGLCVGTRCDNVADSPQIPVFQHWSRGSRTTAASPNRRSAEQKPRHVKSVMTGAKVFHFTPAAGWERKSASWLVIYFCFYLKYLNATQGQSQCKRGLNFLLVL